MSPRSTALPPPSPVFETEYIFPLIAAARWAGVTSLTPFQQGAAGGVIRPVSSNQFAAVSQGTAPTGMRQGAIANGTSLAESRLGRACCRMGVSGAGTRGAGIAFNGWNPYQTVSGAGGQHVPPESVVGIFDFNISLEYAAGTAPGWADDTAPICFYPLALGTPNVGNVVPGNGVATFGGFGIFCNDDGAGVGRYEWVSWQAGGTILERVPILEPHDPELWNTLRVIIISAIGGSPPTVELELNGVSILERTFGTSVLETFDDMCGNVGAMTLVPSMLAVGPDDDGVFWDCYFRLGCFLPDGTEVAAP